MMVGCTLVSSINYITPGHMVTCLLIGQGFIRMLQNLQTLQCRRIMVLVATRRSVHAGFGMATSLPLSTLDAESAEALIRALAGPGIEWGQKDASRLVDICGHNPLALEILAGFIKGKFCKPQVCIALTPVPQV